MKKKFSKKIMGAAAIAIAFAGISIHSTAAGDHQDFTSVNIQSYGTFTYDDGDASNDNGHDHDLLIDTADLANLSTAVEELQQAFQDGVNKIYNKLDGLGFTPKTKSPDDINEAAQDMHDGRYGEGHADGAAQVQADAKITYTYHQHTGSPASGGGCYTKANYTVIEGAGCGASLYAGTPEGQTGDFDLYGGGCPNGNWGGGVHSPGPGWTTCTVHYTQVITGYNPGCGMSANTVTGAAIEFEGTRRSPVAAGDYPDFTYVNTQSYGTFTYDDGNAGNNNGHDNDLFIHTADMANMSNAVKELQESFRDGMDKIADKLAVLGSTPEAKSPDNISEAIHDIYDGRYREGYIDGVSQMQPDAKVIYIYHEHTGDSESGGGCYTEAGTENGTIYILDCGMSTNTIIGAAIEFNQNHAKLIESGTESGED